jgi:hypothetical protein
MAPSSLAIVSLISVQLKKFNTSTSIFDISMLAMAYISAIICQMLEEIGIVSIWLVYLNIYWKDPIKVRSEHLEIGFDIVYMEADSCDDAGSC